MFRNATPTAALLLAAFCGLGVAQDRPLNQAPKGFASLFNGKDLTGWNGRQGTYSPYEQAKLAAEQLAAKKAEWDADRDKHWRVDTAKGEIVSDGQGVHLVTAREYGDFEFSIDWLMVSANGDSGIYLRSYPQVQIWDPQNPKEVPNGAENGSGALWNNNADNPGKWPLVKADNPVGEWNTLRVKMIGSRVWIWLNGKQTVDGQILDNYFDRAKPVLPRGPIELQTHGSEIRFRNVFVREIPVDEANTTLDKRISDGFTSVCNGRDLTGWAGPVEEYQVEDGAIMCKPGKGGTIYVSDEYGDFEAKLEFKLPVPPRNSVGTGGNSRWRDQGHRHADPGTPTGACRPRPGQQPSEMEIPRRTTPVGRELSMAPRAAVSAGPLTGCGPRSTASNHQPSIRGHFYRGKNGDISIEA
jgi:hypothetical protein